MLSVLRPLASHERWKKYFSRWIHFQLAVIFLHGWILSTPKAFASEGKVVEGGSFIVLWSFATLAQICLEALKQIIFEASTIPAASWICCKVSSFFLLKSKAWRVTSMMKRKARKNYFCLVLVDFVGEKKFQNFEFVWERSMNKPCEKYQIAWVCLY